MHKYKTPGMQSKYAAFAGRMSLAMGNTPTIISFIRWRDDIYPDDKPTLTAGQIDLLADLK